MGLLDSQAAGQGAWQLAELMNQLGHALSYQWMNAARTVKHA